MFFVCNSFLSLYIRTFNEKQKKNSKESAVYII